MTAKVKPRIKLTFNPIEGSFSLVTDNNFSYEVIPSPQFLIVPQGNQMMVVEEVDVEGTLWLEGAMILER